MAEKIVDGYRLTFDSEWTKKIESCQHWTLYWNQANFVSDFVKKEEQIIEIGVGSKFLSNYLKSKGWNVTTIDIDPEKRPDIVTDISSFDFTKISLDCVLAFEIFEHLPYPLFRNTINNIADSRPRLILFSLPSSRRNIANISIKLPAINTIKINCYMPRNKIVTLNHFWELLKRGKNSTKVIEKGDKVLVSLNVVTDAFKEIGYNLKLLKTVDNINFFCALLE